MQLSETIGAFRFIGLVVFVGLLAQPLAAQRSKRQRQNNPPPSVAADTSQAMSPSGAGVLRFDTLYHNFGRVVQGAVVKVEFGFLNIGGEPVVIERVKPSCGCTVSEYPDKPVRPGDRGIVVATFNSAGKLGPQEKTLIVYSNADNPTTVLTLVGEVYSELLPEGRGGGYRNP